MLENRNKKGQFVKGKNVQDLTGQRFGRLTVVRLSERRSGRKTFWICKCDCGNEKIVRSDIIKSGNTRSCGCLHKEQAIRNVSKNHKHKMSYTPLHYRWLNIKDRCNNSRNGSYQRYGGRGIKVCEEWNNNFQAFYDWAVSNGYKESLSIERKDVNKGYSPSNCEWIPMIEQANNRRSTIWIKHEDEKMNLMQLSKKVGINYGTLLRRYNNGYRGDSLIRPLEFKSAKKRNGNSNLKIEEVREIKFLLQTTDLTLLEIGNRYNVSKCCIHNIKTEKTWENTEKNA